MDFPKETASVLPFYAKIYPELHLFCSLKYNWIFLAFRPSWKLLSVPWLELKMSLLVENKSYPSWDGQTVRQFPAIPAMSSNSFLLCFISPFFIFTAQYFSISWYLLPFSLTKYLTTCYLASYSAMISWSSVSTSLQCTHDTNADFTCFAYKLLYVRLLLQISLWCALYLLTDLDTPGFDILNISTTLLSWNNLSFQLLLPWADHVANWNFYPSAEPIKTSSNQWLTPPGIRLYISLMHQSLYNLIGSTWIK